VAEGDRGWQRGEVQAAHHDDVYMNLIVAGVDGHSLGLLLQLLHRILGALCLCHLS
jgi:hypothetical protein